MRRLLLVMFLLWPGVALASSNHCWQVTYTQGGFERFAVGTPVTAAFSSNPGVIVAGPVYVDTEGWACLCLSTSTNYHVTLNGKVLPGLYLAVSGSGSCS